MKAFEIVSDFFSHKDFEVCSDLTIRLLARNF